MNSWTVFWRRSSTRDNNVLVPTKRFRCVITITCRNAPYWWKSLRRNAGFHTVPYYLVYHCTRTESNIAEWHCATMSAQAGWVVASQLTKGTSTSTTIWLPRYFNCCASCFLSNSVIVDSKILRSINRTMVRIAAKNECLHDCDKLCILPRKIALVLSQLV